MRILLTISCLLLLLGCGVGSDGDGLILAADEYLDGGDSTIGVILCHGRGGNPTSAVVNPLRKGLNTQLGYHTLSLQMPISNAAWYDYDKLFPEAYKKIEAGIKRLREEAGVETIYLMGHSMGSRMATAYLAKYDDSGFAGFIGVGIRNGGENPLDSDYNLRQFDLPVIDVYGDGGDGVDAYHAQTRSDLVDENYTQVFISGANHKFSDHEEEMVTAVVDWLSDQP